MKLGAALAHYRKAVEHTTRIRDEGNYVEFMEAIAEETRAFERVVDAAHRMGREKERVH